MNPELFPAIIGETTLNMLGGKSTIPAVHVSVPASDEDFQRLLLRIAAHANESSDSESLILLFCQATREFFQASGVYFWRRRSDRELIGEQADGKLAERFMGLRLRPEESAVTVEAVQSRRTLYVNQVHSSNFPRAREFDACSLMAAPLVVFDEVIGATTFLHDSDENFFSDDMAAKATILAGQLGSLLEATRLNRAAREEHRRAEILADVAHVLHGAPDVSAIIEALADRLRILLRTRLVSVLMRQDGPFELRAVSAETPQLANSVRARHDRQTIRFASDLAQRAVAAGEPITLSIGTDVHSLDNLVSPGMLIAAPFRTARTQAAILIYPRQESVFTADEKALVSAIAGFGAVAVAHAELHAIAHAQAHELHQLLEISSELGASGDLEHFLQAFVVRAADFLGFGRCFIALVEEDQFKVRYGVDKGEPKRLDVVFPEGVATRSLRAKEVFWTNEAGEMPGANLNVVLQYHVHQFLSVPLLGAEGQVVGMFGVLDRLDGAGITPEDVRRARALSNQAAVVLEIAHNLHLSQQHRRRAELLIELAREIDGALRLPDFARRFLSHAAELMGATAGALTLFQDGRHQTIAVHPLTDPESQDFAGRKRLADGADHLRIEPPAETFLRPTDEQEAHVSELHASAGRTDDDESAADVHLAEHRSAEIYSSESSTDKFDRVLAPALAEVVALHSDSVISGSAADLFGVEAASTLDWKDCIIVRLPGSNGQIFGLLCLARRVGSLTEEDRCFLEAMATHASMALENSRLFTRMEQANRHWIEIFDAITDFIVVHDKKENVLRVNRSLASMIGVQPAELIGINMRDLAALTGGIAGYSCPFCRSLAADSDEFVHPVLDRSYLVSTSRVHDASSEGLQTIHVLKDITDRREAEHRYRELFDNIQEGLFFSTPEGRFVEVNDALVRMLGYAGRDELLQVDISTEIYFSPEERERHAAAMNQEGHLRNFESTLRRKDGSTIHVLINAFGLHDNHGRLLQIRGLMLDVTGLRTSQSELHRERDFSAKILSNTQSLILVADTEGLITYANRRWCDSGFQQRDLLGRPLLELAAPGYVRPLADAIENTVSGQQIDNLELQIMRGNGPGWQFSANLSPMRDEQGTIVSIVLVLTDITDSAVLRDKLVHAEKMAAVGQLVSGVAHEVNNPLTAILGFADLLMENPEMPETARKDLRVILQEAQRTKQIVQNLLSFARQMPPQRNAVQVNSILRRTLQLRSYDFNSHGVDIVEHLDDSLPEVIGDYHQLQQVFLNVLNNAYDAVHDVGRPARIEIMTTKSGNAVEISFRDNGYGVSHPDKIFDPFFTTKEVGKGTGLGLSICYGIVKEHGGEILCHNNTGTEGATFIVRLPTAPHTASVGMAAGVIQP